MSINREAWLRVADDRELAKLKRGEDPRPYLVALSRAGKLESTLSLEEIVAHLKSGALSGIPVDLSGREFSSEVDLSGADLREVNLGRTDLRWADLWRANLQGAKLQGAYLQMAKLQEASLQGADLREAKLHGADLRGAKLRKANLQGADLRGAGLQEANLAGANLRYVNLLGADLREAIYDPSQLEGTIGTPIT